MSRRASASVGPPHPTRSGGTKSSIRPNIAAAAAAAGPSAQRATSAGRPAPAAVNISHAGTSNPNRSRSASVHSVDLPSSLQPQDVQFPPSRGLSPDRGRSGGNGGNGIVGLRPGAQSSLNTSFAPSASVSRRSSLNSSYTQHPPPPGSSLAAAYIGTPSPDAPLFTGNNVQVGGGGVVAGRNMPLLSMSQLDSMLESPPRPTRTQQQQFQQNITQQPHQQQLPPWAQQSFVPQLPSQTVPQTQVHIHQYVSPPHGPGFSHAIHPLSPPTHIPSAASQLQQVPYSQLYGSTQGLGASGTTAATVGGGVQQQHIFLPTQNVLVPSAASSVIYPSPQPQLQSSQLHESYGAGLSRRPILRDGSAGTIPTTEGQVRYPPFPQSMMSPRSDGTTARMATTGVNSLALTKFGENSPPPPPTSSALGKSAANTLSESYAGFAALNENIRSLKVSSQRKNYEAFQAELAKELFVLALEHWAHKEHLKVFRSWKYIVADRKHRLEHMKFHLIHKRTHQLFKEWSYRCAWRKRLAALTILALEHWARTHTRKSFFRLRSRVRLLHTKESDLIGKKLHRMFLDWQLGTAVRRNQIARVQLVQIRAERRDRANAFDRWKQAIFCRIVEKEWNKRHISKHLSTIWNQWREAQYYNSLERRATVAALTGVKKRAYSAWRYNYALEQMAAKYRMKRYSRICLKRWIASSKRKGVVYQLDRRARLHNESVVFHTWRNVQKLQRAHRKAEQFAFVALQAHALRAWITAFHHSRRAALAWRMAVSFQQSRSRQSAVITWARWARQSNHIHRARTGIESVHRLYSMRTALSHWVDARADLHLRRFQELLARSHELGFRLRLIMHFWSNYVRRKYDRPMKNIMRPKQLSRAEQDATRIETDNLRASMGPSFSPSNSVRFFEPASPSRGVSSLLSGSDFFTSAQSTLPARLTGHTRLSHTDLGPTDDGDEIATFAPTSPRRQSNIRVFVPYAAQISMSELYHAHRNYRLILRRWAALTRVSRHIARQLRPQAELQYIKQLLRGWHRSAKKSKLYTHASLTTRANDRAALLVSAYNSWVTGFNKQKHLDSLFDRFTVLTTEKVWLKWRFIFQVRQTHQLKYRVIQQQVVVRRFWLDWRAKFAVHVLLQNVLYRLEQRWKSVAVSRWASKLRLELRFRRLRHRLVKTALFRLWRRTVNIKKNLMQLTAAWEESRPRKQTAMLFAHWKAYYDHNEQCRIIAAAHRAWRIFSIWQRRAHWANFDRRCISTFAARRQLTLIINSWQAWKVRLIEQRAEIVIIRRASIHLWWRNVANQQKERGMKQWIGQFNHQHTLHRVLHAFQSHVVRRKYVRRQTIRAIRQYQLPHLQTCMFVHWLRYVMQHKSMTLQADTYWATRIVKQLYQRMREKFIFRQALRRQLQRIVPFVGRPKQNIAVQLWRRYAASHKIVRQRMDRFHAQFALPVASMYRRKLLMDSIHEWGVAFAIKRRTKALQLILQARTEVTRLRRAWLDWSFHLRAGWLWNRIQQRRFIVILAAYSQASHAGRIVRQRTEGRKAAAVLSYWRLKTHRLMQHRALSSAFRAQRVTFALMRDAYAVWRTSFLLLVGPLAAMEARRNRSSMQRRIVDWIETINSRHVYRWAVQLFKQKLASLLDRELHRLREASINKRRQELREQRASEAQAEGRFVDMDDEAEVEEELALAADASASENEPLSYQHLYPSMLTQSFGGISAPANVVALLPERLAVSADPARAEELNAAAISVYPVGSQLTVARFGAMVQRWRTLDLSLPFVQWRGVLRARKAREAAHARAVTHYAITLQRSIFSGWSAWMVRVRRARAALQLGRLHTLESMMRRWQQFVYQEKQLTAASQTANTVIVKDAWSSWRARLYWEQRVRTGEVSSVTHWAQRLSASHFFIWKSNASKLRSLSHRHKQFVHQQLYQLQYRAFAHWLSLYVVSNTQRRQLILAVAHARATLFRRILGAWTEFRMHSKAQKSVADQGFLREHMRLISNLWLFWRGRFARARASKLRLAVFLHRASVRSQANRFRAWRSWSNRSHRDRVAVVGYIRSRLQKMVWTRWIEAQVDQRRDNALQLQAKRHQLYVLQPERMRASLLFWHWSKQREIKLRAGLQFLLSQRTQPRFFIAWRIYVQRRRLAFRYFRAKLTRRTMLEWFRRYTQSKFLRSAEERVVEKWECFNLRGIMRAWKSYARRQATLRDGARLLVTCKGGVPVYSSCPLLAAVPPPSTLARLPTSVPAVRDEERLRLLQHGVAKFFSFGAQRHEVRAINEAKYNPFSKQVRMQGASDQQYSSVHIPSGVAALLAPFSESTLFDANIDPTSRRNRGRPVLSVDSSSALMPTTGSAASAIYCSEPFVRSLSSPDPRAQAIHNNMCAGLLSFHAIQRELTGLPILIPSDRLEEGAMTAMKYAVDDVSDNEAIIVYRSPSLMQRALFTFWFTSAQMLQRARQFRLLARKRWVVSAFRLSREQRQLQRRKRQIASDLRQRQQERYAFRLWAAGVSVQKQVDEQAQELYWSASTRMATRHAVSAVGFWADWARRERLLRDRREQWDNNSRLYALSVWNWRASRGAQIKRSYESLWLAHHRALLQARFDEWRIKAIQNSHLKRLCAIVERWNGQKCMNQWKAAALTTAVQQFDGERRAHLQSEALRLMHRFVVSRQHIRVAVNTITTRRNACILRASWSQWIETQMRIRRWNIVSNKHRRLVLQDFLTAWSECAQLQLNLRNRDSDFTRILSLRKTQTSWQHWVSIFRLRRLQRQNMERRTREHLQEWILLMRVRRVYENRHCRIFWHGWMQYIAQRRFALVRASRFHELFRARSMLRSWRRSLLTPEQKATLAAAAVHLWRANKRRLAATLFGHWRALARAKKPIDVQAQINRSRLSTMRELSHLVSASTVARTNISHPSHRSRSPSPSPVGAATLVHGDITAPMASPSAHTRRGILRSSYVGAPSGDKLAEEVKHASPSPSPTRRRRTMTASVNQRVGLASLPTASRATLASLRTFLHSPPRTGLRVKAEVDPRDAYAKASAQLDRALAIDESDMDESIPVHQHNDSISSVSSLGEEAVLLATGGRHSLGTFIPAEALRIASPSKEARERDQADRSMRRSLHASQLQH
jgi:hypothetical protein